MSNHKHPYDDFEEEMERMLENLSEACDEEDFGYFSVGTPRRIADFSGIMGDAGSEEDSRAPEVECRHSGKPIKRELLNSVYYECQCGKYLGKKNPDDK